MRRRTSADDALGLVVLWGVLCCDVFFNVERFLITLCPLEFGFIPLEVGMIDLIEKPTIVQCFGGPATFVRRLPHVEEAEITSVGLIQAYVDLLEFVDLVFRI